MRAGTREAITLTTSNTQSEATSRADDKADNTDRSAPGAGDTRASEGAATGTDGRGTAHAPQVDGDRAATPTFAELGVRDEVVRALSEAGIEHTFAIQELTLPLALRGEDVIGQARTGTGKTLGFGAPLLHRLTLPGDGTPQVLVVVPTRELCLQVTRDIDDAGKHLGVRTLSVYGGRPYEPQIEALRAGVDVVIGTPGRLLDLAEQQHLVLGKVSGLVLDEADEMLDLGFLPDIERILRMVPEKRQTMLFSATMPGPIINLARTFLTKPTHIRAEQADEGTIHERTRQFIYRAHAMDKGELIAKVLQAEGRGLTMIFARTKRTAQKIVDDLTERGFSAAAVHGDLGQGAREQALRAFRTGKVDILVATDVAARGIDVTDVTHVINYQCPEDEKTYVHRVGRTGRAGREGVAITLVDWDEEPRWKIIDDALQLGRPQPVETYSTSQHLHSDLGIPADATGRLPLSKRTRAGLSAEPNDEAKPRQRQRRTRGSGSGRGQQQPRNRGDRQGEAGGETTDESRPGNRRRRRRTRSGSEVAANQGGAEVAATDSGQPAGERAQESSSGSARQRRRRTRGGRRRGGGSTGAQSNAAQ